MSDVFTTDILADHLTTAAWTTRQYNDAYKDWKENEGDNPEAVDALLAEHAQIEATELKPVKTIDLQKRTSHIATQMGGLVSPSLFST